MSKNAAVQPAKEEVKATGVVAPVVEKREVATTKIAAPAPSKPAATAAAVEKVAAKPKAVKKAAAAQATQKPAADKPASTPKAAAKSVKTVPAAKEKIVEAPKVDKAEKASKAKKQAPKKAKLVRDSFTIPEPDYALFATLKERALAAGVEVKKSEILRAAVATLAKLDNAELVKAIGLVERIKTGRPKK